MWEFIRKICYDFARLHNQNPRIMTSFYMGCVALLMILCATFAQEKEPRKNIVIIIADDLGWNDVSLHGTDQVITPNIDMLGYSGVAFSRYYSHCICTPSRSALLTGKYAYTLGMQGYPLTNSEDRGLLITEKILPQYLKELGYATHLVGKWHVGSSREKYLPTKRGFDSHFGHRGGFVDYYEYTLEETWDIGKISGMGLFRNNSPDWDAEGYITDLYTKEAISIIKSHDKSTPLFLMLAHNAPHGSNEGAILQAPPEEVRSMRHVESPQRRIFAAMMKKLDDSVGDVIESLAERDILKNTVVLFISDNGGMTSGDSLNYGSNWPLRGLKMSPFEGGVRVTAALWTPEITNNHFYEGYVHVSDWLPTLLSAIGVDPPRDIDGNNIWNLILNGQNSTRNEIVDIDDTIGYSFIISGDYKLITGNVTHAYSNYQGGDLLGIIGNPPNYIESLKNSKAFNVFKKMEKSNTTSYISVRNMMKIQCDEGILESMCIPDDRNICLYNIRTDPCETKDLSKIHPDIVEELLSRLEMERKRLIPRTLPIVRNPRSNPVLYNYTWEVFF